MMGKPVKISVIVPVYNPGDGIRRCIQSLRDQTLKEIEILFVDDCGTDHSMSLVEKAAGIDRRIRIIRNEKNSGAGPSRNRGINEAAGKYLSFIDPDDYVFPDFLERLYKKAEKTGADIVKGVLRESRYVNGKKIINPPSTLNLRIKKGLGQGHPLYTLFYFEHTTAIYRNEAVKKALAYYGTSSNAEDIVFLLRICFGCRQIEFENKAVYVYVERDGSNNRKASVKRLNGEIQSVAEMMDYLNSHGRDTTEGYEYISKFVTKILEVQKVISQDPKMKKEMIEAHRNIRSILFKNSIALAELKKVNAIIGAFADFDINLAVLPYSRFWYEGPYKVYKEQIRTWVDFLCDHPDYVGEIQPTLWRVFESAIVFDNWKEEKDFTRRTELKEIRRQAYRIPDRRVLTDNYISMKLFIDYGINVFGLRESLFGNIVKRVAVLMR